MDEPEQTGLGRFGSGDDDRPVAAEAAAVAGNGGPGADVVDTSEFRYPDAEGELELAVTQVDYTVEGRGDDEHPVIHVFGRTPGDNEAVHVEVYEFRPYFYAPAATVDEDDLGGYERITGWETEDDEGDPYESIRGEPLVKIFGQTPRDVGQIRDEFDHYEADILFPNRFLIDKDVKSGVRVPARWLDEGENRVRVHHEEVVPTDASATPRVNTFDIEVDDRSGFPEDGEETIVCLTSHDSYRDEYVTWLYESPAGVDGPEALDGYEPIGESFDADVRVFAEEERMLAAFLDYVEATDPDVLTGWNFADFDAPYLIDRLEELQGPGHDGDLAIERLSPVGEVWRSDWQGPDIKGRVVFDLLRAYKRTQFTELESYRLDAVGETELGVGKERYPGDIGDLWEQDPERLLEYNLRDVELCVELDRKQDIIAFFEEVASFVGCKLEDAPTPGDAVDMYVLHKAHGEFALPSKGTVETGEEFEGGAVFEPITGVKEMVSVLDLKCFSSDTEVLTPDGARNITEVEPGDDVYTLNPDTFECEVKPVAETHEYENRFGELHHISGNTHDLKVTENHRFLVSKERGWDDQTPDDFAFAAYDELVDSERYAFPQHEPMSGRQPETFDLVDEVEDGHVVVYYDDDLRRFRNRMPEELTGELELVHGSSERMGLKRKVGKYLVPVTTYRDHREVIDEHADEVFLKYGKGHCETPLSFRMEDWLEFLGWFVTEGSTDRVNEGLTIHQADEQGREAIRGLLERMGIDHSQDDRGVNVSNSVLFEWLEANCGTGYETKQLPEWVFDLDASLLDRLLETLIRGDGSRADSGLGKFWTKSEQLKDDVVDIAVRCGHKPTATRQSDGTWYVSVGKRGSFEKRANAEVEPHDGTVHCLTAEDNHVVLAGRNGHFQWVGQSLYPMCMVTINASPETKVDPGTYDGETYVAPNGQHFRKDPPGMMRDMIDELLTEREEKKAKRNQHDPDEEAYDLYDRQQAAVKVIMNCFTPDTDVLTPEGVRNLRDLEVGDPVYSLNPETMEAEVRPVVETHAYPDYDGKLVDVETDEIDFRVTPNHRMLVRKAETNGVTWDEDDYRFVEAGNLDHATNYQLPHDWSMDHGDAIETVDLTDLVDDYEVWVRPGVHGHTFAAELGYYPDKVLKNDIGKEGYVLSPEEFETNRGYIEEVCERSYVHADSGRKWIPRTYDADDFLELLAWYIAEGSVYTSEEKRFGEKLRGSATTIRLAQDAPPVADGGVTATADGDRTSDHAAIGDLLDRMGFDYYADDEGYQFTSRLLGRLLEDLCGADSFEKRVPEFVFDAGEDQKRRFLDTLVAGDGDRGRNSWRYSTASERLRDDVLRLCTHLGLTANYRSDDGTWRIYVSEGSKNTLRMHRSATRSQAENGVYCVTVEDNNTLLAGRNGKFQFVGQSLYGVSGWDRFRLYDKDNAAAVTATGREVINYTETSVNDEGYDVVYGDSVTGDRPVVVRSPDGMVRILPIERLFEQAKPTTGSNPLPAADGGHTSVVDDSKERLSLEGWEALSLSEEGNAEWQPIDQIIRHETEKPVLKLQHKFGESVTTRDHTYVVDRDGGLAEASPEEVNEPLRIPDVPDIDPIDEIDVYEVLHGYTRTYEDGRSVGKESARKKIKRIHANEEWVWFGHEHHLGQDKTIKVQRYIDPEGEDGRALLRLLAAYVSEGSSSTVETTDSRFGASICQSNREWLEGLQADYHYLFSNTTAGIVASDAREDRTVTYETSDGERATTYDDGTLKLQMMNELAAVFFREFAGQTSGGKRVPSFVFHLNDPEQKLFLDVLVEGDGSRELPRYTDKYATQNFDFETTSRELAAGLSMLLTQRDKKHSLKYRDSKNSYTIRTCEYYRSGRDPVLTETDHDGYVYDLDVARNDNFVDAVGGIVLHNTDSVMIEYGADMSKGETIDVSFDLEERINDSYDEFAREQLNAESHRFEIEFEKLYRRFFQAGKKKRYAGHIVWKEGKDVDDIDITGFEYQRSDIAPITKEVQREVIEMIVTGEDIEEVKSYLHGVIEEFRAGEVDLEEIGIPGGIGKRLDNYDTDTAQVRGAKYANLLLGTNFQRGSKPKRLYLEKVHPDYFERIERERDLDPSEDVLYGEFRRDPDVICFEYADQVPDEFAVDYDKMLDKTLKGPIARILEALDVSWEEVKSGQEQTGLGQFM